MLKKTITPLPSKVWLSSPTMHGEELKYMQEAYSTNWMSTVGANINGVEELSAKACGKAYAVALSSGTAALHLAMIAAGIGQGTPVFCTDMTFAATANPLLYEKARPIFIDSEYETWNMDPAALEKAFALHPEVKHVVLAELYGTPAKVEEILAICHRHDAVLIEDAAEALGASVNGRPCGSFGDYSAISFNGNKIITGSSGGVFLTDDKVAADTVRKWSTQSREPAPWYQHTCAGYNYRMSNVIAGVVRGQFPYLKEHIAQKKAIYDRYREGLKDLPIQMNPVYGDANYWLSCLIINKEAMCQQNRTDLEAFFTAESGKSCPTEILQALASLNAEGRPIWKPMHMQPVFADCEYVGSGINEDIFARGLCLPSDNKMAIEAQNAVIETIRSCFA